MQFELQILTKISLTRGVVDRILELLGDVVKEFGCISLKTSKLFAVDETVPNEFKLIWKNKIGSVSLCSLYSRRISVTLKSRCLERIDKISPSFVRRRVKHFIHSFPMASVLFFCAKEIAQFNHNCTQ